MALIISFQMPPPWNSSQTYGLYRRSPRQQSNADASKRDAWRHNASLCLLFAANGISTSRRHESKVLAWPISHYFSTPHRAHYRHFFGTHAAYRAFNISVIDIFSRCTATLRLIIRLLERRLSDSRADFLIGAAKNVAAVRHRRRCTASAPGCLIVIHFDIQSIGRRSPFPLNTSGRRRRSIHNTSRYSAAKACRALSRRARDCARRASFFGGRASGAAIERQPRAAHIDADYGQACTHVTTGGTGAD